MKKMFNLIESKNNNLDIVIDHNNINLKFEISYKSDIGFFVSNKKTNNHVVDFFINDVNQYLKQSPALASYDFFVKHVTNFNLNKYLSNKISFIQDNITFNNFFKTLDCTVATAKRKFNNPKTITLKDLVQISQSISLDINDFLNIFLNYKNEKIKILDTSLKYDVSYSFKIELLKKHLRNRHLKLINLYKILDISKPSFNMRVSGKKFFTYEEMLKISTVLDLELNDIFNLFFTIKK